MIGRLWGRFKSWVKQTRVYRYIFGAPLGEQQPLLQPEQLPVDVPVQPEAINPAAQSPRQSLVGIQETLQNRPNQDKANNAALERQSRLVAAMRVNRKRCLLSHTQIAELYDLRNDSTSRFSMFGRDVIQAITNATDAAFDPASDIAKLLHEVAYGNPAAVIAMLDKNPRLLLEAGNVMDPAGNSILRVTPYECALGAGDDDMAATIGEYFAKLEDGEKERTRQYARYEAPIANMLKQPAYDFSALLQIIKDSPATAVTAALTLDFNADIPLHAALEAFREHFAPRVIEGGMHFNYANLLEAFNVYANEFNNLKAASENNYNKCDLFWRQVLGFIQRGLPACDRQAFAQGIYYIIEDKEVLRRTFDFRHGGGTFPISAGDCSRSGLGFEFGSVFDDGRAVGREECGWPRTSAASGNLEKLCRAKTSNLENLCSQPSNQMRAGV